MKSNILCILFTLFLSTSLGFAQESGALKGYSIIGRGLLEFPFFGTDLYNITYLENKKIKGRSLKLEFVRDIARKHLRKGWEKGLKKNMDNFSRDNTEYKWLWDNTIDAKEGDTLIILVEGDKVQMIHNNKVVAERTSNELSSIALSPWIGKNPVDEELKEKLVGSK